MIIAVFARGLDKKVTGRGMVAAEFVLALRRVRPDIEIHLFAATDPGWSGVAFHAAKGSGAIADLWRMARGVAQELRSLRPDAFWCATHLLPLGLPSHLPTVVTLLDVVWRDCPETMSASHRHVAAFAERGLRRADRIICISRFTQGRLAHHWPELESRARPVLLAPGSSILEARMLSPMEAGGPIVVNVDTIEPRKNLAVLFDAMTHLPDATLLQSGNIGWKVDDLVARASRMPNVRLLGYSDNQIVHSLYRSATVAVFPAIYEGFHLPPLEAMALGCPVVASDIPVHREILGDAAIFVRPGDPEALAATLRRLINDESERSRLAAAGRKRAALFSWDASALELAAIIEEAVGEHSRRQNNRN